VLNDPAAKASDIANALVEAQKAAELADTDYDELREVVIGLLMNNEVEDLGYPGEVGNRWVNGWSKGNPMNRGANVIISGTIDFGFRVLEELAGLYPVQPTENEAVRVAINCSADEDGTPQEGSAVLAGG
jgi:hypothetical protein